MSCVERGVGVGRTGVYSREPVYGLLLRSALALGFQVVGYDVKAGSQSERFEGGATALACLLEQDPASRLVVLGGMGNISEDPGQPLDEFSMADWFRRKSGIDPLTVATDRLLALDPNADIDNAGELRAGFAYELVDLQGSGYAAKHFDVSVYVHGSSERGAPDTWLTLRGARMPVAVSLVSCGFRSPGCRKRGCASLIADATAGFRAVDDDAGIVSGC